jgi:hypothetical protein
VAGSERNGMKINRQKRNKIKQEETKLLYSPFLVLTWPFVVQSKPFFFSCAYVFFAVMFVSRIQRLFVGFHVVKGVWWLLEDRMPKRRKAHKENARK